MCLAFCSGKHVYEYPAEDEKTAALLAATDTIGVTFCESPAIKKALRYTCASTISP
jgi:hypothetical protein